MIDTKLILIEGSIGSGKTSTAKNLADKINTKSLKAIWYHENAPDNPLNTYLSRSLQENYGKQFDIRSTIEKFRRNDPEVDSIRLWKSFTEACLHREEITILEGRFWQHEAMNLFLMGCDLAQIQNHQQEIVDILSLNRPILVYLASDQIEAVIKNTFLARPLEWQHWVLWLFGEFPYFQSRNLMGIDGFIEFFKAWNLAAEKLFNLYPYMKVELRNPHLDWEVSLENMYNALGLV